MEPTAISLAARALRSRLAAALAIVEGNIFIGQPTEANKAATGDAPFLNIFVFQIDLSGYPADAASEDPVYARLYCLITAFAGADTNETGQVLVSAGENDLRMIGSVAAALHRQPHLTIDDPSGEISAQLQISPMPMSLDNLNNLWSTQLEASYRPSVAYELSFVPVPFSEKLERSALVQTTEVDVQPRAGEPAPWRPEIRLIRTEGDESEFVSALTIERPAPATVNIALAGPENVPVDFKWQRLQRGAGWQDGPSFSLPIDSDTLGGSTEHEIDFPSVDANTLQAVLVATHTSVSDKGRTTVARSNPLLITFVEAEE